MKRIPYKGHIIEAGFYELRDGLGYAARIFIERRYGWGVEVTEFHLPRIFKTAQVASSVATDAGRYAIDSGYEVGATRSCLAS